MIVIIIIVIIVVIKHILKKLSLSNPSQKGRRRDKVYFFKLELCNFINKFKQFLYKQADKK